MSPSNNTKRTERTPLIESGIASNINNNNHISDSLVNKSTVDLQTGVSWGVAAFLLVNTALGAGMLNYPYAYNQIGGVLAAALIQVVLLIFIASTMFILVYCADINQDDSYHDVLMSMCGKRAQQISAFSIFLTCYGINVTFLVIIGDQYDRIFNSLLYDYMDDYWPFLDRKFTIFITSILFIWPMCYAKRLDFLRHASILGLFAMLYVAFLTVYEHYKLDERTINAIIELTNNSTAQKQTITTTTAPATNISVAHNNKTMLAKTVQWFQPLAIVPVLCFAYQTHEVIVPVYACLKQRSIGHFMKASLFGLIILFILYNIVGAFGYLTFRSSVGADIMSLYDAKDPVVVIGIIALVIKFITTYPPLMFCGRGALDGLYGEFRKLSPNEFKSNERIRRIFISTIWFFSTVLLAVFAPDISVTLQLLGSMASINVFVFPGMCLISLTKRLRRARMALLIEDFQEYSNYGRQQRAKDYYLISGSYFSKLKRDQESSSAILRATAAENSYHQHIAATNDKYHRHHKQWQGQKLTATFSSLMEFENMTGSCCYSSNNGNNRPHQRYNNGYGSSSYNNQNHPTHHNHQNEDCHMRNQRRQEKFGGLISNGSFSFQDYQQHEPKASNGYPINDSYDDYSDCDSRCTYFKDNHDHLQTRCDMIRSNKANNRTSILTSNGTGCAKETPLDLNNSLSSNLDDNDHHSNKSSNIGIAGCFLTDSNKYNHNRLQLNQQQQEANLIQNHSWKNNKSTTASILDRLGSSIAPSTVAQIGISRCTAVGLYLFSAIIIIFGTFIFVLELITVLGFLQ